jgi:8-oxo-dGTP diphosphatase
MDIKLFVATKALIRHNGKVLLLKESTKYEEGTNAGKYDVVGGRLKPGEHFAESLLREIREETGLEVKVIKPLSVDEWRPVVKGEQWQVVGITFLCEADIDNVILSEDHSEFIWIDPNEYKDYPILIGCHGAFEELLSMAGARY